MPLAVLMLAVLAASPGPHARAKVLADRAAREYDLGQFDKAIADAQAAYLIYPEDALLFDLGQFYRAAGRWADAERAYRNYLRVSGGKNLAFVEGLIAKMEAAQKAQAAEAARAPVPGPAPTSTPAAPQGRARARAASASHEREAAPSSRGPGDVRRETPSGVRAGGSRLVSAASPALHPVPAAAVAEPVARAHHALAWGLGAGAVACAAVAAVGLGEVEGYNGLVHQVGETNDSTTFHARAAQAQTARGPAQAWQIAAIAGAVAAVALGTGMGLAW